MLIRRHEDVGYESFETGGCGGLRCARFKGVHFPGVEGARHLHEQPGKLIGHSHLHQDGPKLIVGHLYVFEVGFPDCLADSCGDFGVGVVALSQQFVGLFAAEGWVQEIVGGCVSDVAGRDHGKLQMCTDRSGHRPHLADRVHLGKRVFHEVSGAQVKNIRAIDLVEFFFKIVKPEDGAGSAGQFRSNAAERNHVSCLRILYRRGDRVAHSIRIAERVSAGGIGWNQDVGGFCLMEGFGEGVGVGNIGDECLRTFGSERL
jgi:hypothetical protein